ncbi:tetratricopeptide repeat protein [Streptomyces violascens]|uniref:tetratricopeptide repeat protein n=1 Tax=Streptomyces violascens TaxID=67381 RepID=UPI0036633562
MAACADAEALLRAGRTSEARKAARAALYTDGPDPCLYAVLGRAYAAEGGPEHADRAEAVFREGLDTFPDDPVLLAAYAASFSPRLASNQGGSEPSARVQRHDARLVLAVVGHPAGAAQQAWAQAQAHPADDRVAVLAETLTALARPGRAPLRLLVRAPLTAGSACWVWFAGWLLAVAALHLPVGVAVAALLGPVLFPLLYGVLRGARRRALGRTPAALAVPSPYDAFPTLPQVPPYTTREKATAAVVLGLVALALVSFVSYLPRR